MTWNRGRRSIGLGAVTGGLVLVGIVALALLPVWGLTARLLGSFVRQMQRPVEAPEALTALDVAMLVFSMALGVIGGLRQRLRLAWRDYGLYPVPAPSLLLAELPLGLAAPVPLVGAAGLAGAMTALLARQPTAWALTLWVYLQAILWLLLLQHLIGNLKRMLFRRPARVLAWALALAAVGAVAIASGPPPVAPASDHALLFRLLDQQPGAYGNRAILLWLQGQRAAALRLAVVPAAFSLLLFVLAIWVHAAEVRVERRTGRIPRRFLFGGRLDRPSIAVGRLFAAQLLRNHTPRAFLFAPALFALAITAARGIVQLDMDPYYTAYQALVPWLRAFLSLPLTAVFLCAVPVLNTGVWLNQFGYDRQGVRVLLSLPLATADLLRGKLLGALAYLGVQAGVGAALLLVVYRPSVTEVLSGLAGAVIVLLGAVAWGHVLSSAHARPVRRDTETALAAVTELAPLVVVLVSGSLVSALYVGAGQLGPWVRVGCMCLVALIAVGAYAALVPWLARAVDARRDRLVRALVS